MAPTYKIDDRVVESNYFDGHEQVVTYRNPKSGLYAIIAVHKSPAIGGCRFWNYPDHDNPDEIKKAALDDVLNLSRAMTRKTALAGLPLYGGKSVIVGDPKTDKTHEWLSEFGCFIRDFNSGFYDNGNHIARENRYIVAEDMGMNVEDIDVVAKHTSCVTGTSWSRGDPSWATAQTVMYGIQTSLMYASSIGWIDNHYMYMNSYAIQGLGNVGWEILRILVEENGRRGNIFVTDTDTNRLKQAKDRYGDLISVVKPDQIYQTGATVFVPCAVGGTLNKSTVEQLARSGTCIVAGSANNQLESYKNAEDMLDAGIVYAPDYVINSGGVIQVCPGLDDHQREPLKSNIRGTLLDIFEKCNDEHSSTQEVADRMADSMVTRSGTIREVVSENY